MLKYQNELKANHIDLDPIRDNEVINHFKKLSQLGNGEQVERAPSTPIMVLQPYFQLIFQLTYFQLIPLTVYAPFLFVFYVFYCTSNRI